MKKQDNIVYWIIGIILFLIVATQVPFKFPFAVVTVVTCADNTLSYFDLETNVLDELGINNGVNNGGIFVPGKIGQGIQFNTTTYVDFPTISSADKTIIMWIKNYSTADDWYFASETNGTAGTNPIIPIGPDFGLGLNGSVDEIAVFSPALTNEEISNLSVGVKICYTTSYEENITCKDYATSQVTDPGYGCLNYSGEFFPHCEYEWLDSSQYKIIDNQCVRFFYCQDPCLTTGNCYLTEQTCIENLVYDCYLLENNICIHKTDYENCTGVDYYSNLTYCQEDLTITIPDGVITTPYTPPTEDTWQEKLDEGLLTIAGVEIKLYHLLLILLLIGTLVYFTEGRKK